jgi:hypothetical protein
VFYWCKLEQKWRKELSIVDYAAHIRARRDDARSLEDLYRDSLRKGEADEFSSAMHACYRESPEVALYAAWHYRLDGAAPASAEGRKVNWQLAVPLSVGLGLVFWILSDPRFEVRNDLPFLALVWAPVGACFVIAFLALASNRGWKAPALAVAGLAGIAAYAVLFATVWQGSPDYQILVAVHLPLLAWTATGVSLLWSAPGDGERFAFLRQSIEVAFTGGLYLAAGVALAVIASGLFEAIGVILPELIRRLLLVGVAGLMPILAVASAYDPGLPPSRQSAQQGLGKLIATLMRLLLPLTLLILVIYLFVIPFNFMAPFRDRDVLIVYNVMLFAIMALLLGATPLAAGDLPPQRQRLLRQGIVAVAALTVLVSLYALSATIYRTVLGGITINRLTIIGWNSVNIGILAWLIYSQLRTGPEGWVGRLQTAFSRGAIAYVAWALFLLVAIPLLFR